MFSKSYSAALYGIQAHTIQVEADVSDGLPCFELVGLLTTEVREAKDRVRVSLRNSSFHLPAKKVTINLSPADIKKEGAGYDLAIAVSVLTAFGHIPQDIIKRIMFIGELSLDGNLQRVNGVLPMVVHAKEKGFEACIVPFSNVKEGAIVQGIQVYGAKSLKEVIEHLLQIRMIPESYVSAKNREKQLHKDIEDYSDIYGQECAKRAIEVAVAGGHHMLFIGSPGSGKTMLAKRIPSIMPPMDWEECLLTTKIHSVAGLLKDGESIVTRRPFCAPHHSVTAAALIGGGKRPRLGQMSIATNGVLFLDELPEFAPHILDMLRQPLEDKKICVNRLYGTIDFPADTMLVCAMNPCRCGYYPDQSRCICTPSQIQRYLHKISGPLLDRIDIFVETAPVDYSEVMHEKKNLSSKDMREHVQVARQIQKKRYKEEQFQYNACLTQHQMKQYCKLDEKPQHMLEQLCQKRLVSFRSCHSILKVARTIADLDESVPIETRHLSQAICYRGFQEKYWGEDSTIYAN